MKRGEFVTAMAAILYTEPETLSDDQPIDPLLWDSIEIMEMIELIDRTGTTVTVADIRSCQTVGEIIRLAHLAPTSVSPASPHLDADTKSSLVPNATPI